MPPLLSPVVPRGQPACWTLCLLSLLVLTAGDGSGRVQR